VQHNIPFNLSKLDSVFFQYFNLNIDWSYWTILVENDTHEQNYKDFTIFKLLNIKIVDSEFEQFAKHTHFKHGEIDHAKRRATSSSTMELTSTKKQIHAMPTATGIRENSSALHY